MWRSKLRDGLKNVFRTREACLQIPGLKTLQVVVELRAANVRQTFKMVHNLQTVGWFRKWLVIMFIGIVLGTVVLHENIIEVIGYIRGGPTH
jgi:hypothetical protein